MDGKKGWMRNWSTDHCPRNAGGDFVGTPMTNAVCRTGHVGWHTANIGVKTVQYAATNTLQLATCNPVANAMGVQCIPAPKIDAMVDVKQIGKHLGFRKQ